MNIQDLLPLFAFELYLLSIWRPPWPQDLPTVLSNALSRLSTTTLRVAHWTEDLFRAFIPQRPTRIPVPPPTPTVMEVAKVPLSFTLITTLVVVFCVFGTPVILVRSRNSGDHPPKNTTRRDLSASCLASLRLDRLFSHGPLNPFELVEIIRGTVLSASVWLRTHLFAPLHTFLADLQLASTPLTSFAMPAVASLMSHFRFLTDGPLTTPPYYPLFSTFYMLICLLVAGSFSWARAIAIFGPNFSPQIFSLLLEINFRLMSRTGLLVRYSTYSFNAFTLSFLIFSTLPRFTHHTLGLFAPSPLRLFTLAAFFGLLAITMDIVDCLYLMPQIVITRQIRVYQDARFSIARFFRIRTRGPTDHLPYLILLSRLFCYGPFEISLDEQSEFAIYLSAIICAIFFSVRLFFWIYLLILEDDDLIVHERLAEIVIDPLPFFFRRQPDPAVEPPEDNEPNIVVRDMHSFETHARWGAFDIVNQGDPDVPMGIG